MCLGGDMDTTINKIACTTNGRKLNSASHIYSSIQVRSECTLPSIAQSPSVSAVSASFSVLSWAARVFTLRDTSVPAQGLQPLPVKRFTAATRVGGRGRGRGSRRGRASSHDRDPVLLGD
ncbi:hypothetical protein E2C01_012570 [Portunus trituberculatus]|uniref:Uncharacterized protein n=1 Tax=Portunus trituberculatus TaxID=210409 RepID=A0A5B7DEL3_PORTR|nr:hypothetical protein [Portunus trituberculatus]